MSQDLHPDVAPAGERPIALLEDDVARLPVLPARRTRTPEWLVRVFVLLFASGLYLPNIGGFGLWDPWETHYGEVTRYMIETGDWVHPWWGWKGEKIGPESGPGEHFHSKPILLFWMEAATIKVIGLSETAIRFPVALIAIVGLFATYFALSKLVGRRRALLATLVLATCPLWFFLARQSQTDMPFVGMLTAAMAFFALAAFGPREPTSDRRFGWLLGVTLFFVLALVVPQLGILIADINHNPLPRPDQRPPGLFDHWRVTGWMQATVYIGILALVLLSVAAPVLRELRTHGGLTDAFKDRWRRRCYLWLFYAFAGLALLGKGLLGFMLPGAVIFVYLLLTNEWRMLGRVELHRGLAIFACVGFPWYVGLLAGPDGQAFWTRFFIHDHFNRLGSGVHSIDDGTYEHFIKWLGYGMWPWSALIPAAFIGLSRLSLRARDAMSRTRVFLFLWAFLAYVLFSMSSTKFHHYIFPSLPPLAMLVGLGLYELRVDRSLAARALVVAGIFLAGVMAWDINANPQHLRNQFTYKYDREWPSEAQRPHDPNGEIWFDKDPKGGLERRQVWADSTFYRHTPVVQQEVLATPFFRLERWIPFVAGVAGLGLLLMVFAGALRTAGIAVMGVTGVAMCLWTLNYYMPMLASHWSQKYIFDRYYELCVPDRVPNEIVDAFTPAIAHVPRLMEFFEPRPKRQCKDQVVSWLLTWRGETFYSDNTIVPLQKDNTQFEPYLTQLNKGARFFVFIERTRMKGFKARADAAMKKLAPRPEFAGIKEYEVTLEYNENYWFVLLEADPICKDGYTKDTVGRCRAATAALPPRAAAPEG